MITAKQQDALRLLGADYPDHPMVKFCERPSEWYGEALHIAVGLDLHKSKPLCVLDIGCGFGYFIQACDDLGHAAGGIDLPDVVILAAASILRAEVAPWKIEACVQLSKVFCRADLITTFGVNFRREDDTYWGVEEYVFFTRDVLEHLNPGGRWVLRPNRPCTWDVGKWVDQIEDFADVHIKGPQYIVRPKESSDASHENH